MSRSNDPTAAKPRKRCCSAPVTCGREFQSYSFPKARGRRTGRCCLSMKVRSSWRFGGTQNIQLRVLEAVSVEGWNTRQSAELRDEVRVRIVQELDRLRGVAA